MGNPCDQTVINHLKAKLASSEREREALQKAHELLNKGFESTCEQMHDLKQTVRSLETKLTESESIRRMLTTDLGKMLNDERSARFKAEAACGEIRKAMDVVSVREVADMTSEERAVWQAALSTDAGQPIIDYIAAARRLRVIIETRLLVSMKQLIEPYLADVDAAEAKLKGGKPCE